MIDIYADASGPVLSASTTYAMTSGRVLGAAAALIALAGVVVAVRAVIRRRPGSRAPLLALTAGAIGILAGGFVVITADGGPGTGNGIVGGFAALVLGVLATVLGAVARRASVHVHTPERFRS